MPQTGFLTFMITFFVCILLLLAGYAVYGKFVEKYFGTDSSRPVPAVTNEDAEETEGIVSDRGKRFSDCAEIS